jgi:mannose-1-phosphate guanylyltransferase
MIHPVIHCSTSGTRLWPLCNNAQPVPFLLLLSEEKLFEPPAHRVAGDNRFAPVTVVAGAAHGGLVLAQLRRGQGRG